MDVSFRIGQLIGLLLLSLNITGCYCADSDKPQQIQFYVRTIGGINDYFTYQDEFRITNYSNKTILLKNLYRFAQTYVDTVYADHQVSIVSFVGQKPCQTLPSDPANDVFDTERKQLLIIFGFDNSFPQNASKKNKTLTNVWIYNNGKSVHYDFDNPKQKRKAIQLLKSDEHFDSDF